MATIPPAEDQWVIRYIDPKTGRQIVYATAYGEDQTRAMTRRCVERYGHRQGVTAVIGAELEIEPLHTAMLLSLDKLEMAAAGSYPASEDL